MGLSLAEKRRILGQAASFLLKLLCWGQTVSASWAVRTWGLIKYGLKIKRGACFWSDVCVRSKARRLLLFLVSSGEEPSDLPRGKVPCADLAFCSWFFVWLRMCLEAGVELGWCLWQPGVRCHLASLKTIACAQQFAHKRRVNVLEEGALKPSCGFKRRLRGGRSRWLRGWSLISVLWPNRPRRQLENRVPAPSCSRGEVKRKGERLDLKMPTMGKEIGG